MPSPTASRAVSGGALIARCPVRQFSNAAAGSVRQFSNGLGVDWSHVEEAIRRNYSHKWAGELLCLMKRYAYVLSTGDASSLWSLEGPRRLRVMKALSALARLTGLMEKWRAIREAYGLKWSLGEKVPSILFTEDSYSRMLEDARKLIDMSSSLKPLLLFTALSGLRVSEALEAVRLYRRLGEDYLNPELGVLEHFRYPAIFIRRTKKAYITVLDDLMTEALRKAEPLSYNALRLRVRRRNGSRCRVYMLRKLWATYMRLRGVEPEVIDLLQGRTPRSIFLKHYYRPDIAPLLEGVRTRLRGLENELGAS